MYESCNFFVNISIEMRWLFGIPFCRVPKNIKKGTKPQKKYKIVTKTVTYICYNCFC